MDERIISKDVWENILKKETIEAPEVKYQYNDKKQYLVNYYKGELEFAIDQTGKQLESLIKREKEEEFTLKAFGGGALAALLFLPLVFLMSICGNPVLGIVASLLLILDVGFVMYAMPICVYMTMRGFVLIQINKQNRFGKWIANRWRVTVFSSEREQCEKQLARFEMFMKDIVDFEEDVKLGEAVSFDPIKHRIDTANIHARVEVTNSRYGDLNQKIKVPSAIATLVIYAMLAMLAFRAYMVIYHEMVYLFQQI